MEEIEVTAEKPKPATPLPVLPALSNPSITVSTTPAGPENKCSRPLSGSANGGRTVNQRRAQVRAELARAMEMARIARTDVSGAALAEIGRNASRLAPNSGTWIRGGTSRADGNYLYGAVTDELGIPISVAIGFGDITEYGDDMFDYISGAQTDGTLGPDSLLAKEQIAAGAKCLGQ